MPAAPLASRPGFRLGRVLVPLLAAVLVLAGCGQVSATVEVTRELIRDGVKDPVVTVEEDAGSRIVTVDYVSGAVDAIELDREQDRVARITWHTIDVQLDVIRVHSASELLDNPPPRRYERPVLAARFGARPESLGRTSPSSVLTTSLLVVIGIVLLLLLLALIGVLLFIRYRRRRAAVMPWMAAGPVYPGWEQYEPAQRPPSPEPARDWPAATPGHAGYPAAARPPARSQAEAWPADDDRTPPARPPERR
jgi:hypothetical protein